MASYWAGQGLLALSLVHARRAEDAAPPLPAAYAVDAGVSSTDGSSAPPADPDPSA
jgi:hypothetical protein